MRSFGVHKVLILALAALALFSCGKKERIIPRGTMADIYADMFIADQWLKADRNEFQRADTMLFYEPIFNNYGYTTTDFRNSAYYYLRDPKRYSRIIQKSASRLKSHYKELEGQFKDRASVNADIITLMAVAHMARVLYDTAFFAKAAGAVPDMAMDEWGAYMPVFSTVAVDSLPPAADSVAVRDSHAKELETSKLEVIEEDEAEVEKDSVAARRPVFQRRERPRTRLR